MSELQKFLVMLDAARRYELDQLRWEKALLKKLLSGTAGKEIRFRP